MPHPAAPAVAVGVPTGVAYVEVAVAAHIIEVIAEQAGGDIMDARVIQQGVEVRTLVDELNRAGSGGAVVYSAVVAAAVSSPDALELIDNFVNRVGQQPRERQEAEGFKECQLLIG